MLRRVLALGIIALSALLASSALAQSTKVRISYNPQIYSYLPLFMAIENGYFAEQKIELEISTYAGSALTQIPMLARGDQDIAVMVAVPGFFNQHDEGFGIKLIASLSQSRKGWHDTMWIMVRKDIWDAGAIKSLADLKGKTIEKGPRGTPIYLAMTEAVKQGGLGSKDVTFTERLRLLPDVFPLFRNKAIDVMTMVEPLAARLEAEGMAVRWKPAHDVLSDFQESDLAANPKFISENRDATKRFLVAVLKGAQAVMAGNGKWTPEMIRTMVKYAKFPEAVIQTIGGPQYAGQLGTIDVKSLERQQEAWMAEGMVKTKTPIQELVDASIVAEARKQLGLE